MTDYRTAGAPIEEARAAAVLVHGRGATAESILSLADALELDDIHYRAPQAPGMTWYPFSFLAPLPQNADGIERGLEAIRSQFTSLAAAGIEPDRTVLLGFSQGACLALEYAARHGGHYAGIVGLSGGLIGNVQLSDGAPPNDKGFEYRHRLDGTAVFLGCSDIDPHIPVERVRSSERVLSSLGADVDLRIYRGMGHTVNEDELKVVQDLLTAVLSG